LKNVDYDDAEVRRYETEAALHWVREYDVDGFRADAAWGVRDRAPDFWLDWRRELVRVKPDLMLVAEATARDAYYFENGFDVAYDWTWELGDWAWKRAWDHPDRRVRLLEKALLNHGGGGFDDDALVLHFLDNNDTGARFITQYGPELVIPATALLLTIPGIPALFTGEEVGAEYEPYDEGPPVAWDDPHGFLPIFQKLTALRSERAALRSKEWTFVDPGSDSVLAYLRTQGGSANDVLVLLNFSDAPVEAHVALADVRGLTDPVDLYEDGAVSVGETALTTTLPAFGVRILGRP
jgi:cyclomaltodextrinase